MYEFQHDRSDRKPRRRRPEAETPSRPECAAPSLPRPADASALVVVVPDADSDWRPAAGDLPDGLHEATCGTCVEWVAGDGCRRGQFRDAGRRATANAPDEDVGYIDPTRRLYCRWYRSKG
jgi:hypothetical protein